MSRECVFCGGRADSLEHVWPQWVSRHFADRLPLTLVDRSRGVPPRSMSILDAHVRRVCQDCNGGWMSQLEMRAKPLLEPMFDGEPVTLERDEQAVVAAWTVKTLMMLDLWQPDPEAFSPTHHQQLHRSAAPPSDTAVLLAFVDRPTQHTFYALPGEKPGELHRLTMNVGCLVGQVRLGAAGGAVQNGSEAKRSAVQVWPRGGDPIDWPPPERLWDGSVSHFATPGRAYD
jgi:hypothetical protein